ncbi:TPA: DUF1642 domain-containing protein [Enterococcus faecium]|uniref:DUF1642 domain-containing protein n=1 Tax=Enterococcus sp. AZ166 TaxID=2774860 RepID=UPI000D6EA240|nr:DUF1642 domain-containing protein [Enterococcus faecium]PWO38672.1 hypothetical protein DKT67_06675 [Enterococcus faecium]
MNKKVLIDKWESKTGAPSYVISDFPINPSKNDMYTFGYGVARKEILEDLKQLDEPQKPVVPKFVADWFEENKDDLDNAIFGYLVFWEERDTDSVLYQWFAKSENNPIENLIRMKDGYEVEKEPLYEVIIGDLYLIKKFNDRNDFCFDTSCSLCTWEKSAYQLTEAEIKAIDDRFWPFAVPVKEVVEG